MQLRQLIATHIDDDSFCRYVIQQDINKIALDLREAHKDDFFSVLEDNPPEDFLQTIDEVVSPDSAPEQMSLAFICAAQAEFEKAVRGRKEVAEKDCTEIGLDEKSNPPAGTEVKRKIGVGGK